jgi:GNAT superfamily N-acetyltransferase
MWLDLATLRDDAIPRREIRIELNPDPNIWDPAKNADYLAEGRLAHTNPDRAVQAVAWADSRPVGVSCAFLTRGSSGIAGVYDVGVLPEYRNQGIGKALTHAVCVWARDRGYRIAGLNATPMGEPVYRALGFHSLRRSETWHCPVEAQRQPIVPEQIALVEAVGTGDLPALEENTGAFAPFVNAMLPCRRTPLQIAALFAQPQTANWLISHGANPDVLAYWGLGWKDETRALLTSRPELVNRRTGDWGQTPLHEAAMRGDVTLMQLLIEAGADLDARDETFHGRPLEWSKHFGQIESERLLEAVMR